MPFANQSLESPNWEQMVDYTHTYTDPLIYIRLMTDPECGLRHGSQDRSKLARTNGPKEKKQKKKKRKRTKSTENGR